MVDEAAILKQVEYYFSDANLKRDHFFQKEISKDPQGYISMDLLLRCNKLKQLTQDAAAVAAAIASSEAVEVSEDKTKVRKTGTVPPLDEDVAARAKSRNTSVEDMTAMIKEKAEAAVKERVVYKLTGLPAGCRWMDIKDALKEAFDTQGRMHVSHEDGQTEAHITAMKDGNTESWAVGATLGDKLKVQDTVITMTAVSEETEALAFWVAEFTKNPPESIKKAKTAPKKEAANKNNKRKASTTVTVCGTEYDYGALKNRVSEISKAHTDDFTGLEGEEKAFVEAVLDFHPRAAEKKANMTGVAVGVNKDFPDTRCFFIVKKDGNEDFSYKKCVDAAFGMEPKKAVKTD